MEKNLENAQVSILLEIDGEMHLVAMTKERLDTIGLIIKKSTEFVIKTNKTQKELNDFLNYTID